MQKTENSSEDSPEDSSEADDEMVEETPRIINEAVSEHS